MRSSPRLALAALPIVCLGLLLSAGQAQDARFFAAPYLATTRFQMNLRAGPGHTHSVSGIVQANAPVALYERSRAGNWVHVKVLSANRDAIIGDGWLVTGFLNIDPALKFSELPENSTIPDSVPQNAESQSLRALYSMPVIPQVSAIMNEVFRQGQALGNQANVITKVGDSVNANTLFLEPMALPQHELGPYDYLLPTIRFFGPSLARPSLASRTSLATFTLLDPRKADASQCQPNEALLRCEYRLKRPSIAVIGFGYNDVLASTDAQYAERMRQIVRESLEMGVIPLLSTFSVDPDSAVWWQAINFNIRLVEIANEFQVPLVNLWAAARILPEYGLERDRTHMKNSGYTYLRFQGGEEAYSGVALQNLLTIRALDELRRVLGMDSQASPIPTPQATPTLVG
ncbi:MAG: hypothetical protein NZ750_06710 [Anaerolineae bacterium]|nr:hypothetical protein [Anaerolineae bacterium]MDW8171180.1 hypothetical protein [Anaerolineae bacterium]